MQISSNENQGSRRNIDTSSLNNGIYDGKFQNGKYHGKGKITYQKGENEEDVYEGAF